MALGEDRLQQVLKELENVLATLNCPKINIVREEKFKFKNQELETEGIQSMDIIVEKKTILKEMEGISNAI